MSDPANRVLRGVVLVVALSLTQASMVLRAQAVDTRPVLASIDAKASTYADVAMKIWSFAEVGYQETRSSALLQEQLKAAGFNVSAGVAEIPTAFVATWGSGKPVIGIVGEFDALPGLSQAAVPDRKPIVDNGPGHGCGHHLFGTASTAAAIAVKEWMAANKRGGTLKFFGTPAEEGGAGKVYMLRAGLFDDVDAVVSWHRRRPQRRQRGELAGQRHRQVPFPRRVGARIGGAAPRPLGARRRRGDEHDGQPHARARAIGRAHSLRDHQRRQRPERRARLCRGLLLRPAQRHARARRHLGTHYQCRPRRRAGHRHEDGARADRRGLERPSEQLPGGGDERSSPRGGRVRVHAGRAGVCRDAFARRSKARCRRSTPRIRSWSRRAASARPRRTWAT